MKLASLLQVLVLACLVLITQPLKNEGEKKGGDYEKVIVKLKTQKKKKIKKFMKKYKQKANNIYKYTVSKFISMSVDSNTLKEIQQDPKVETVQREYEMEVFANLKSRKNFKKENIQVIPWGVEAVLQEVDSIWTGIGAEQPKKRICIADTGYDLGHEDLPQQEGTVQGVDGYKEFWGSDFDGHGTNHAGVITALSNTVGVRGIIENPDVVITKACNVTFCTIPGIFDALEACVALNSDVISMSFGCNGCYDPLLEELLQDFYNQGILLVAPAGDTFTLTDFYPASYSSVIAVAASNEFEKLEDFSTRNAQVELTAPGRNVLTTDLLDEYSYFDGTALAAAHVAGAATLVWSLFPDCSNTQIRNVLDFTAKQLQGYTECNQETGFGLIQAKSAYDFLMQDGSCGANIGASLAVGGCPQLDGPCTSDDSCNDDDECTVNRCTLETGVCNFNLLNCNNCGKTTITLLIFTDEFPSETQWEVINTSTQDVIESGNAGFSPSTLTSTKFCLNDGNYEFTIYDSFGDGICCDFGNGNYEVYVGNTLVAGGGSFGPSETTSFVVGSGAKKRKREKNSNE